MCETEPVKPAITEEIAPVSEEGVNKIEPFEPEVVEEVVSDAEFMNFNGVDVRVINYQGYRVLTLEQICEIHGRSRNSAKNNYITNKKHFNENEDYFMVTRPTILADLPEGVFSKFAPQGLLFTESGYMKLVKSFTDDYSWDIQKTLVNTYFAARQLHQRIQDENVVMIPKERLEELEALVSLRTPVTNEVAERVMELMAKYQGQKEDAVVPTGTDTNILALLKQATAAIESGQITIQQQKEQISQLSKSTNAFSAPRSRSGCPHRLN